MENLDFIFFINLERRPERKAHFIEQCRKQGLPFDKIMCFEAIDAETYNFNETELKLFEEADYRTKHYNKKIMGNQLSHFFILKHMVKSGYKNILVFQDDAVFRDGFRDELENLMTHIPKDAQLINMGLHRFCSEEKFVCWDFNDTDDLVYICEKPVNPYLCYWHRWMNPCSLGYLVTELGARKMVEYFEKVGFKSATDINYNEYLVNKRVFYGTTKVLVTTNRDF